MRSTILSVIRGLCGQDSIEPHQAAAVLQRDLLLDEEDEYAVLYKLSGGAARPFDEGWVTRLKELDKTRVWIGIEESCRFPVVQAVSALDDLGDCVPMLADPEDPEPKDAYAFKVAAGELRLLSFRDGLLCGFIISGVPEVDWEASA